MSGSIEKDSSKDVDEDYDRQVSILCELIQGTTLLKAGRSVSCDSFREPLALQKN